MIHNKHSAKIETGPLEDKSGLFLPHCFDPLEVDVRVWRRPRILRSRLMRPPFALVSLRASQEPRPSAVLRAGRRKSPLKPGNRLLCGNDYVQLCMWLQHRPWVTGGT